MGITGILLINVNHNSSTALERSVIDNGGGGGGLGGGGLKLVCHAPNITLRFCCGSQHLVSCSVLVVNLELVMEIINHDNHQLNQKRRLPVTKSQKAA